MLRRTWQLVAALLFVCVSSGDAHGPTTTLVVLVRHAEKVTDGAVDPGLTSAGTYRAGVLAQVLADAGIERIVTTQLRRTRDTARPLAGRNDIVPEVIAVTRDLDRHIQQVADTIRAMPGKAVLVVGHSNTITRIVQALGGPAIANLEEWQYSILFTLVISGSQPTRLIRSHFGSVAAGPRTKS